MGCFQSCLDRPTDGVYMSQFRKYLTYETVKLVQIDDLFLGTLHYVVLFLIFAYVAVYNVAYQTQYILFETPIGSVRTSLQGPTDISKGFPCDPTKPANPPCNYNFTPPEFLPYCSQGSNKLYGAGQQPQLCKNWDQGDVISPVTGDDVLYVATRVQETNETLHCQFPRDDGTCKYTYEIACNHTYDLHHGCTPELAATRSFYVADIERFTMLVDHSVRSPTVASLQGDSSNMDGFLEKCDGTLVNPDHTPNGQDILSIQQLLDAATFGTDQCGYDLDRTSSVFGSTNTSRYDGIILVVTINYQNVKPWSGRQSNISYTYKVNVLKGTKSKIARTIYVEYPFTRVVRDAHGIKLVVEQSGQLGAFDLTTLLLQLSTSTALLAAGTTVLDTMAVSILPSRAAYKNAKYDYIEVLEKRGGTARALLRNPPKRDETRMIQPDGASSD